MGQVGLIRGWGYLFSSKPWLSVQLRLQKLREQQHELGPEIYASRLAELHQALMQFGEWWIGIEDDVF